MGAQRVLLLGASGFLGRAVGDALDADTRVAAVVRVGSRVSAGTTAGWVRHDLLSTSAADLIALLRDTRPDVVVDCVGKLAGSEEAIVAANVLVPARLLDAMPIGAPGARLVVIGSAAEYGVVPRGTPVTEDARAAPVGTYGITKLATTQLVRAAVTAGRIDGVVLRVFNPIGPDLPTENLLGRAAAGLLAALGAGEGAVRLGPLGACRDFVDVRDVATAVRTVTLAATAGELVLNVGSGVATTARHAVARLADIAGFHGRVEESDPPPARSAAVDWIAADTTRLRRLGWRPEHDLDSSLRTVWAAASGDVVPAGAPLATTAYL
ncbi:MAG: NAD-dependent epimerase/dehydratase family protein [Kineosporiaceae bacterium]